MGPYYVTVQPDTCAGQECFIAFHPELPGCMAQGDTPAEAQANLDLARADYIEASRKAGIPIPDPSYFTPGTKGAIVTIHLTYNGGSQ